MVRRIVARGLSSNRSDDNEATARRRIEVFREQSAAPLRRLRELGFPVWTVDSLAAPQENARRLLDMPLFRIRT